MFRIRGALQHIVIVPTTLIAAVRAQCPGTAHRKTNTTDFLSRSMARDLSRNEPNRLWPRPMRNRSALRALPPAFATACSSRAAALIETRRTSEPTIMPSPSRTKLLALVLATVIAGAAAHAAADDAFDTSLLPQMEGSRQLFAMAPTTIYTSPESVAQAAAFTRDALAKIGWLEYVDPFSTRADFPTNKTLMFKNGWKGLSVFITVAPAQRNATSVQYTAVALENDLPFPKDAADIEFAPERPHLNLTTATPIDATLAFYRQELGALGWSLWSIKDSARQSPEGDAGELSAGGSRAFYVRDDRKPLLLLLTRRDDGRTRVELKAVPPSLLIAQSAPPKPADPAKPPSASSEATAAAAAAQARITKMDAAFDKMADEILKQMVAVTSEALGSLMNQGKAPPPTGGDAPVRARAGGNAPMPEELEADEKSGLPVPKRRTLVGTEGTKFRLTLNVRTAADLASVLAFYRRELAARGWNADDKTAEIARERVQIAYTAPDGPALLKLSREDDETVVSLLLRKSAEAAKSGLLPKPGQTRAMFGNMLDKEAVITINRRTNKVAAGAGAKQPDGPTLNLPPGRYKVALKVAGEPSQSEDVTVGADEIWGLLIGPGGLLPLQMY
jgi:hypothetical protein